MQIILVTRKPDVQPQGAWVVFAVVPGYHGCRSAAVPGVSPGRRDRAPLWSVMRGGLEVTFGAGTEVPAEPVVSLRMADGSEVRRLLRDVRARQVAAAVPWRAARSARGQSHYPGFYWAETTGSHVVYESRLELARLLVADFDPAVTAIAAQPFLLRALAGGRMRSFSSLSIAPLGF